MTKIIGISGRKQSGKSTVANFINGSILKSKNMIEEFKIDESGRLNVKTTDQNGTSGWGILDVTRKDNEFVRYAESELWPYVKVYHFADYLKQMCVDLFDLTPQQVYGTDDDKNTATSYSQNGWKHKMTAREFLQYFGTDIMRKIKDTVWVDYTIKKIRQDDSTIALVPDVRFPNEVESIQRVGGSVIRLTRDPHCSNHPCETALDEDQYNWSKFDYILHNDKSNSQNEMYKDKTSLEGLTAELQQLSWSWS